MGDFIYIPGAGAGSGVSNNYAASVAPTSTDDSSGGYVIGSSWLIPSTGEMWRCRSNTTGSAVWVKIDTADFSVFVPNQWYLPFGVNPPSTSTAMAANSLRLFYGVIKQRLTINLLGARMNTAVTGNAQLGVYRHGVGVPTGPCLAFTGSMSTGGAGTVISAAPGSGTLQLEPGPYWFGTMTDGAPTMYGFGAGASFATMVGSSNAGDILSAAPAQGVSTPATFGTWADLTAATFTKMGTGIPSVMFQVQSVP